MQWVNRSQLSVDLNHLDKVKPPFQINHPWYFLCKPEVADLFYFVFDLLLKRIDSEYCIFEVEKTRINKWCSLFSCLICDLTAYKLRDKFLSQVDIMDRGACEVLKVWLLRALKQKLVKEVLFNDWPVYELVVAKLKQLEEKDWY